MKELDCLFIGSSTKDILMLVEAPPASIWCRSWQ